MTKSLVDKGHETKAQEDLARSRLEVAQAELDAAKATQGLLKPRAEQIDRAEAEVRLAEADRNRCEALRKKYELRAQHDGRVTARRVNVGEVVSPGQVLLLLNNTKDMRVRAKVQETQLAQIALGSVAQILADAWPEIRLTGEATEILKRVDPASGSVDVLLKLTDAPADKLTDGMAVDIAFISGERRDVLRIPAAAVEKVAGKTRVAVREGTSFSPREIQVGLAGVQWVEVVSGLRAGDVVRIDR
jgi:RND family efflux transporter MFP subunit